MFDSPLLSTAASVIAGTAVALVLLGDHAGERLGRTIHTAYRAVLTLGVTVLAAFVIWLAAERMNGRAEWDFLVFWLTGQVAMSGGDVYDPGAFRTVALPFPVSPEFETEVLDNGSFYPPITLPLFFPLGLLPYRAAHIFWYALNGWAMIWCVVLLARRLAPGLGATAVSTFPGRRPLAVAAALLLLMPATASLVRHGQTGFLLLLAVLLVQTRDDWRGGTALGAGIAVKPLLAVLLAPFVVSPRRLRVLGAAGLVIVLLSVLVALTCSSDVFAGFSRRTYVYPAWIYFEPMNQSVLAHVLRLTGARPAMPMWYPPFLALGSLLVLALAGRVWRTRHDREELPHTVELALLTALLVYPGTLKHYSVLLCVPAVGLWTTGQRRGTPVRAAVLVGLIYTLAGVHDGNIAVLATLLALGAWWWSRTRPPLSIR